MGEPGHCGGCSRQFPLRHASREIVLATTVYVRCLLPCILSPSAKFDRGFYLVYDKHHTLVLPDDPGSLGPLGSRVATTAGRRRRGVPTRGGSPRNNKRDATLRARRARSLSLGPPAGHVGGARHAPTPSSELCRAKDDRRPPLAHWPPHSEERSDQLRTAGPLRGPLRVDVPILSRQSGKTCPAVACVLKLPR